MTQYLVTYEMAVPKQQAVTKQFNFTPSIGVHFVDELKVLIAASAQKEIYSEYTYRQTMRDIDAIRILFMMEIKSSE